MNQTYFLVRFSSFPFQGWIALVFGRFLGFSSKFLPLPIFQLYIYCSVIYFCEKLFTLKGIIFSDDLILRLLHLFKLSVLYNFFSTKFIVILKHLASYTSNIAWNLQLFGNFPFRSLPFFWCSNRVVVKSRWMIHLFQTKPAGMIIITVRSDLCKKTVSFIYGKSISLM